MIVPRPIGLLAELTHRCPLGCPYCSNPLEMIRPNEELAASGWARAFQEAADLGVLQLHLSGGEPAARRDLADIVAAARAAELYSNLITSGIGLNAERLRGLKDAGLDHVQLSIQDTDAAGSDAIGFYEGGFARKRALALATTELGLPLTINAPLHRANTHHARRFIDMALELAAGRIELAHVQYYGWALLNRAALMPTRAQLDDTITVVTAARAELEGRLVIDFVLPDYYGETPKPCMGGWGREVIVIAPNGDVLPCHAARTIPGLAFENIRNQSLAAIWDGSAAFNRFRGTDWMAAPCRGCARAEIDWGGCRCQALALAGTADATDPVCALSPAHARLQALAEASLTPQPYRPRRYGGQSG